ncbi:hypothetical protein Acr_17g0009190 [Actinidia rufa]|uniref:Uncharacterized protein n=1 Tax=Actinidia rufa TaxID=165716 RepID=A0A7J0G3J4_9ERIC|nr:hypothetical protein Acr_17g0009190 [Actinidia rufa]
MRANPVLAPREGTSTNPGHVLRLVASILENPAVTKKLLKGVIPLLDKEEVEKLDLDLEISRLCHEVGQAQADSIRTKMVCAQQRATELEGQVADLGAQEQKAIEELKKMREDRDATIQKLKKENAELKAKEILAKNSAIEEYKSSDDFLEAAEQAASKYFGEGFDLCKT